jgi:capsid portal protein
MAWYNFKSKNTTETISPLMSEFSTPFGKIGDGNLSMPYVRAYGSERYIRFGQDNLYPQIINQIYYMSPLNGSIINFKANSVIGGGFELTSPADQSAQQKVKEYTFIKKNKFTKIMRQSTKDLIMHGRVCIIVDPTNTDIKLERVGPEKVRNNKQKTIFTISDDWSRSVDMYELPAYNPSLKCKSLYLYEIDGDAGQDIYPIPQYCSALNWAFVDGESSYLHKSNIINSIFPSFMISLAKKFGNQDEIDKFKDTIQKAKGAPAAGRIMTFVANTKEELPTITAIPTNSNDSLFTQTDERIDANISRAHSIDPLLMGIRVSGKLGSGNEIQQSYIIFEKNVVMPLREMVTEIGDDLLSIANINSSININNYQIIGEVIVDTTKKPV